MFEFKIFNFLILSEDENHSHLNDLNALNLNKFYQPNYTTEIN